MHHRSHFGGLFRRDFDRLLAKLQRLLELIFEFRVLLQQILQQIKRAVVGRIDLRGGDECLYGFAILALAGQCNPEVLVRVGALRINLDGSSAMDFALGEPVGRVQTEPEIVIDEIPGKRVGRLDTKASL